MRSERTRGLMTAAVILSVAAVIVGACQPSESIAPSAIAGENVYTICPFGGELPAKEITDRAVEILGARLASLGVETSSIGVGACIDVTATTTSPEHEAAVRAAVNGTGSIAFVSLPVAGAQTTFVGGAPPDGAAPVLFGTDFSSAEAVAMRSTGTPALTLNFSDAGSATIASWSRQHRGEVAALVVDGVVVALPTINDPWTQGDVTLSMGETPPVSPEAMAAMVNSGPLPPEWAQPERPQG